MTPSELKKNVLKTIFYPFFHRKTMKHWGDTMKNFRVKTTTIQTLAGKKEVYELYRKNPVKSGVKQSHFWDKETFHLYRTYTKKGNQIIYTLCATD
ncbi:MAG: hypothetical protein WC942_09865 [Clostridia bacterium]|jgi:hypothetical protein